MLRIEGRSHPAYRRRRPRDPRSVSFAYESGHPPRRLGCALSAISRHWRVRKERRNDGTDGHQDIEYCH